MTQVLEAEQFYINLINEKAGVDRDAELIYCDWLDEQSRYQEADTWRALIALGKQPVYDYHDTEMGLVFDGWRWYPDPTHSLGFFANYWKDRIPQATLPMDIWHKLYEISETYFPGMNQAVKVFIEHPKVLQGMINE